MDLSTKDRPGLRIVKVHDSRIDAAVAIQFKDKMRDVTQDGPKRVILDLSDVTFIDSSGLGAVVAAMKLLHGAHILELAGLTPVVAKVFKLTRMESVFKIHDSVGSVLARMAS
ncbi:STAS domain-containing protein [Shimia ponticola]|uniref:STAS domain-containing protein n=1 Tax=Shimia ponticola TaxID=2582893 RepID=UPI0011BECEA1|nr:STAS domain-containing protein [Shimia ponticola]